MGVIAWAVPGLAAGLPASGLVSGTRSQGLPMTSVPGCAGAGRPRWLAHRQMTRSRDPMRVPPRALKRLLPIPAPPWVC
jgi:uncharacterized membrane protein YeaQ/YmgE (transglycosylase-associated protein family)